MAFTVKIKLASWVDADPAQAYTVGDIPQLMDLSRSLLGTRFNFNPKEKPTHFVENPGSRFVFKDNIGNEVTVLADKKYESYDELLDEIGQAAEAKVSLWKSFNDFLKKILNPFRWGRHGVTFAAVAVVTGIGLSLTNPALLTSLLPALTGVATLGITVGLPMLLVAGLVETILEYRQARKNIQFHAFAGDYVINYGFFTYLSDVIKHWGGQHKGQATIMGIGITLFIAALILTIPYCIDPAGSFSFMSTVLDPIVHFLSQGIAALAAMPQFEFLSGIQPLALAGGLLISSALAVPLTLKNLIQGGYEVQDSMYRYEDEDADTKQAILDAYKAPETQKSLPLFCGLKLHVDKAKMTAVEEKVCAHERELVIR